MRLAMVRWADGRSEPAAIGEGEVLLPLGETFAGLRARGLLPDDRPPDLDSLFRSPDPREAVEAVRDALGAIVPRDPEGARFRVPLRGGDLLCVGRNYAAHARELNNPVPAEPVFFLKPRAALIATGEPILLPADAERVEYEGELVLITGRRLTGREDAEQALEALLAVTLMNDVTDRGVQARLKREGKPWLRAKGRPTFAPCGPALYFPDSPGEVTALRFRTLVNGELRQEGSPEDWLWSAGELLAAAGRAVGLRPGDLLATGTPAGVGPLAEGDFVEVACPPIGTLGNPVASEDSG